MGRLLSTRAQRAKNFAAYNHARHFIYTRAARDFLEIIIHARAQREKIFACCNHAQPYFVYTRAARDFCEILIQARAVRETILSGNNDAQQEFIYTGAARFSGWGDYYPRARSARKFLQLITTPTISSTRAQREIFENYHPRARAQREKIFACCNHAQPDFVYTRAARDFLEILIQARAVRETMVFR